MSGEAELTAMSRFPKRLIWSVCVLALVACLGLVIAHTRSAAPVVSEPASSQQTLSSSPTTLVDPAIEQAAANFPRPLYGAADRQTIYTAALAWSSCMRTHGVGDFPVPDASFGDGKTPPMIVGGPDSSDMAPGSIWG